MNVKGFRSIASALALTALFGSLAACGSDEDTATTTAESAAVTTAASATTALTAATTVDSTHDTAATEVSTAESTADSAGESTEAALAALYEAAKLEGEVVVYTAANEVQIAPAVAGFEERYPGIKVTWSRSSTPELIQRFSAEFDSGVNTTDVIHAPDQQFVADAIEADRLVALNAAGLPGGFPGTFPAEWVIDDGAIGAQTVTLSGFAYNSGVIDAADAPATWEDLLDPQWKGNIIALDPAKAGGAIYQFWDFVERALGPEYLEKFAAQDPIWYDSAVPGAQAHAAGEAGLFIPAFPSLTEQMKANGAPVVQVEQNTATGVIFSAMPVVNAPHPNAALLFVYDMYGKASADAFAVASGQVSPWGGGASSPPSTFLFPNQLDDARKAELSSLLGLG